MGFVGGMTASSRQYEFVGRYGYGSSARAEANFYHWGSNRGNNPAADEMDAAGRPGSRPASSCCVVAASDHGSANDHGYANDHGQANDHGRANNHGHADDHGRADDHRRATNHDDDNDHDNDNDNGRAIDHSRAIVGGAGGSNRKLGQKWNGHCPAS
jgi:hypothetical protein